MSFFTSIDRKIDEIINGGALDVAKALADPTGDFLTLMAGAALAGWAAMAAFRGTFSLDGFITFVTRYALFYSLITLGPLWTTVVYPFISAFPQDLGNTIFAHFGGDGGSSPGGEAPSLITGLVQFFSTSVTAISNALSSVNIGLGDLFNGGATDELLIIVTSMTTLLQIFAMAVLALAGIIISKMLIAILLSIMPVMVVWAYLKSTAEIMNGWIRGITMLMLFQVLIYGVLGTVLAAAQQMEESLKENTDANIGILGDTAGFMILSGIGILCLLACPMIAQRIGGAAISLGDSMIKGAAVGGGKQAWNAGKKLFGNNNNDPIGPAGQERQKAANAETSSGGSGSSFSNEYPPNAPGHMVSADRLEQIKKATARLSKM